MAPFDRSHASSYSSSIVTMGVSCTVFEIKRDFDRKTPIFHTPLEFNSHDSLALVRLSVQNLAQTAQVPKLLDDVKYSSRALQTDGRCHKPNVTIRYDTIVCI